STNLCDDRRRVPGVSSRMRVTPCGSETCVVAAQDEPVRACRLAANTNPVRGIATDPIARNTWVRSLGRSPVAFVRVFGSRPNVTALPNVELNWPSPAPLPLDDSNPSVLDKV